MRARLFGLPFLGALIYCTLPSARGDSIFPAEQWKQATPFEMGMDEKDLHQAREYALTGGESGYIVRGGKLIMSCPR